MRASPTSLVQLLSRLAALCLVFSLVSSVAVAQEANRFGLFVGANIGGPDETPLRYAEADAVRLAEVMQLVGGLPEENITLLLGSTADEFEARLAALEERIVEAQRVHGDALLMVYFSGHADANALHLSGTYVAFDRLKDLLDRSRADARILIIDACRSGELTRVKGAVAAQPFQIQTQQWTVPRGMAIITSAAAGEDAQESERLRGGFFTHHLITGLVGAASTDDDGAVTLQSLYRYAYEETVRSTSRAPFVQHPTYNFDMRGRDDIVLAHPGRFTRGMGQLELAEPGTYVVFDGSADGPIAADLTVEQPTRLTLAQGQYFLRHRRPDGIYETTVEVLDGQLAHFRGGGDELQRIPYAVVARRGIVDGPSSTYGFALGGGVAQEVLDGTGLMALGTLRAQTARSPLTLQLGMRLGTSRGGNDLLQIQQRLLGVEAGAIYTTDLRRVSAGVGLRTGVDLLRQQLQAGAPQSSRTSTVGRIGPLLHLEVHISPRFSLYLDGGVDAAFLRRFDPTQTQDSTVVRLVPFATSGISLHLLR